MATSALLGVVGCIHKGESRDSDCMMFMAAFLLVVMATLLLRSGNVERNPGPTVIGKRLLLHSSFYRRSHVVNSKTTTCIIYQLACMHP